MGIRARLYKAIELQKIISFDYEKKRRVVEPYHYGVLGGKEQLHCYQTQGNSNSGHIPQWRNFQLTHIKHLRVDDNAYFDIREDYNPGNANYTTIEKSVDDLPVSRP